MRNFSPFVSVLQVLSDQEEFNRVYSKSYSQCFSSSSSQTISSKSSFSNNASKD